MQCPTSIFIVEFSQKLTLMDALINPDMKLDDLYISSFVQDLIKVRVHSNLWLLIWFRVWFTYTRAQ